MTTYLYVFLGGGLGSVLRLLISRLVYSKFDQINPVATFTSNLISSAIIGIILLAVSQKLSLPESLKFFLIVGFCGGFSTFSTFSFETFELLRLGHYLWASLNIAVSITFCVGFIFLLYKLIY